MIFAYFCASMVQDKELIVVPCSTTLYKTAVSDTGVDAGLPTENVHPHCSKNRLIEIVSESQTSGTSYRYSFLINKGSTVSCTAAAGLTLQTGRWFKT